MKPMGGGYIVKKPTGVSPVECLYYAMSLPTSVVITGCDSMKILHQALNAARDFQPMTKTEVASLLGRTSPLAQKANTSTTKPNRNSTRPRNFRSSSADFPGGLQPRTRGFGAGC